MIRRPISIIPVLAFVSGVLVVHPGAGSEPSPLDRVRGRAETSSAENCWDVQSPPGMNFYVYALATDTNGDL